VAYYCDCTRQQGTSVGRWSGVFPQSMRKVTGYTAPRDYPGVAPRLSSRICRQGTQRPSAEYSAILFRSVRTEMPSNRADAVLFP